MPTILSSYVSGPSGHMYDICQLVAIAYGEITDYELILMYMAHVITLVPYYYHIIPEILVPVMLVS